MHRSQPIVPPAMLLRRLGYYLRSIPTLLLGLQPWPLVLACFLGLPIPTPFTIRLRGSGLRFMVRTAMDLWIVKETCLDRDYERIGVPVADGWQVIDIGGALGDFAIAAAQAQPRAMIHVYEPFARSFELLQANLDLNAIRNVVAFPEAVGSAAGSATLDVSTAVAVRHSTVVAGADGVRVPVVALAGAVARLPGDRCDLLKLDCEGAEYDILMGAAPGTLDRIARVVLEYHEGVVAFSGADLAAFLRSQGYTVRVAPSRVKPDIGLLYAQRTS